MLKTNVFLDDLLMFWGAALQRVLLALVSSALVFTGCAGGGIGPAPVTERDKMQTDKRMGTREAGAKPAAVVELAPGDDIQKALDLAEPGDTIVLKDGVYYQSLRIACGGTPGKPVTLRAAHGGGATLSGAVPRDRANLKFEWVEGDLYKAAVSNRVWWVMVGERNLVNYGQVDLLKQFMFPDQGDGKLNPCAPEGFAWQDGTLYIRLEKGADPNAEPVEISRLTDGEIDPDYGKPGHKGHWAPDSGFKVPGLGCLYSHSVGLIRVKADNVVIEGLRLHMGVGAAVIVHGNDVTIRDCYITGAHMGVCQPDSVALPQHKTPGERPINLGNRTGRGLTVEYCEFTAPPGYRFCRSGTWGGLYGSNIAAVFMNYGGPRSVVRHNWVYDSAQDHLQPRGNGTTAPEDAGEIAYNFIQNCGDDSIEFDSSTPMNLRVHHNVIVDTSLCLMSLCPVMGGGLTIDHNLFYQSPENSPQGRPWLKLGSPWGWGLPTRGVRIIHNTVVQPHGCLRWFGDGDHYKDMLIENNIIYNGEAQTWDCFPISSNNLYCGPNVKAEHIPQVIHGEQPFVSLNPIDFNIRPGSAAVDAGAPGKDAEYFHKSAGKAPDLGAIELGETWQFPRPGPRWAAGSEIVGRPALPASLKAKWVGLE
jgi:hypothetical protein